MGYKFPLIVITVLMITEVSQFVKGSLAAVLVGFTDAALTNQRTVERLLPLIKITRWT
jgi:hypothetical protein